MVPLFSEILALKKHNHFRNEGLSWLQQELGMFVQAEIAHNCPRGHTTTHGLMSTVKPAGWRAFLSRGKFHPNVLAPLADLSVMYADILDSLIILSQFWIPCSIAWTMI